MFYCPMEIESTSYLVVGKVYIPGDTCMLRYSASVMIPSLSCFPEECRKVILVSVFNEIENKYSVEVMGDDARYVAEQIFVEKMFNEGCLEG